MMNWSVRFRRVGAPSEGVRCGSTRRTYTVPHSLPFLHRSFYFAAGFTRLDGCSSIMQLLAFSQPELDLGKASLGKIDAERDERESLLLRLAEELIDFFAVEEQFPSSEGLVIHDVAMTIGADVAVVKKHLPVLYTGVTIL